MWRLTVSALIAAILIWIAWAMGLLGVPGLALADEQSKILQELHSQKIERLETKILQSQRDFCASPQGSRPREFYLGLRNMALNEYQKATGSPYVGLPGCGEL